MAEDKVYRPEEIDDQPFPTEGEIDLGVSQKTSGGVYTPKEFKDNPLPVRKTAHELVGIALNTRSRKILAEFEFTEHGAIRIGRYTPGVSGDLSLAPTGLVARNAAGITTFAIDGETGDATFLGAVQAGSIISDSELVGGSININDNFVVDEDGNVTIVATANITVGGDNVNTNAEIHNMLSPGEASHQGVPFQTYHDWSGSGSVSTLFALDGDNFTNQNVYFECVFGADDVGTETVYARLYNITDVAAVANSELSNTWPGDGGPTRERSAALTFPSGQHIYRVEVKGGDADVVGNYYTAKLIVIQQ